MLFNSWVSKSSILSTLFQDHWVAALQTLELSLDEVVHIRLVGNNPSEEEFDNFLQVCSDQS